MSNLLINEHPLQVLPSLAIRIGLEESIVLQQIHYWLTIQQRAGNERVFRDGRWWTYNTAELWQKNQFSWWSLPTVRRILQTLVDMKLLVTEQWEKSLGQTRKWYTIDYQAVKALESVSPDTCFDSRSERTSLIKSLVEKIDPLLKLINPLDQIDQSFLNTKTSSKTSLPPTPQAQKPKERERDSQLEPTDNANNPPQRRPTIPDTPIAQTSFPDQPTDPVEDLTSGGGQSIVGNKVIKVESDNGHPELPDTSSGELNVTYDVGSDNTSVSDKHNAVVNPSDSLPSGGFIGNFAGDIANEIIPGQGLDRTDEQKGCIDSKVFSDTSIGIFNNTVNLSANEHQSVSGAYSGIFDRNSIGLSVNGESKPGGLENEINLDSSRGSEPEFSNNSGISSTGIGGRLEEPSVGLPTGGEFGISVQGTVPEPERVEVSENNCEAQPHYRDRTAERFNRTAEKQIYEIAPGVPDPSFVKWRSRHYLEQGGRWAETARSSAKAEIRNNPAKALDLWDDYQDYVESQQQRRSQQVQAQQRQAALAESGEPDWRNFRETEILDLCHKYVELGRENFFAAAAWHESWLKHITQLRRYADIIKNLEVQKNGTTEQSEQSGIVHGRQQNPPIQRGGRGRNLGRNPVRPGSDEQSSRFAPMGSLLAGQPQDYLPGSAHSVQRGKAD